MDPELANPPVEDVPSPPHAGMAIFEAESLEKIYEVFRDEDYLRLVRPDEEKYINITDTEFVGGPFASIIVR